MTRYYFDTSALVKRYRPEDGSNRIDRVFADSGVEILISRLAVIELHSALAMHVRMGSLTERALQLARRRFFADAQQGTIAVARLLVTHYKSAERLILKHSTIRKLRTLDALQLAVALHHHRTQPLNAFVCADSALCEIAQLEGLNILNPVQPAT